MTSILETVDQRTKLVGENRLELLLFRLEDQQLYGINVFKVKEVLQCPKLSEIPKRHTAIRGVANIRGSTVPVLDLNLAVHKPPLDNVNKCFVIISEYNRTTQGFLVKSVDRIVNLNWEDIHPPPKGSGRGNYLTAVTNFKNEIIEIIDVEKILSEVAPSYDDELSDEFIMSREGVDHSNVHLKVMVADDSAVARRQIKRCIEKMGVDVDVFSDGKEAFEHLKEMESSGVNPCDEYVMLISDIEMPEMDGYTLVANIRSGDQMSGLHIILHTSLSGVFNEAMVDKVGANDFLAKFKPEELASKVAGKIEEVKGIKLFNDGSDREAQ
jgi:two-component system chemotaxis response regulator CheV